MTYEMARSLATSVFGGQVLRVQGQNATPMNLFAGWRPRWGFSKDNCDLTGGNQRNFIRVRVGRCRIFFLRFWLLFFRHRTDSSIHDIRKLQLVTL